MEDLVKFAAFSSLTAIDDLTTAFACSRYGMNIEKAGWRRKLMQKLGVWRSIPIQSAVSQIVYYSPILVTYLAERYFNPDTEPWIYNLVLTTFALPIAYTTCLNILKLRSKRLEDLTNN